VIAKGLPYSCFLLASTSCFTCSCADTGTLKEETCMPEAMRQGFICLRPPPLLDFWLRWFSNFVDSESSQIQSVKFLQNMVSNRTRQTQPPPSHILSPVLKHMEGGGELNQREGLKENSSQSWVEYTNMTISPVYKLL
jgi:hypothetical protein